MKQKMRKILFGFAIAVFAGIFLFSGWKVIDTLLEYREGERLYADLQQYVSLPSAPTQPPSGDPTDPPEDTQPTDPPEQSIWPVVDFASLQKINSDVVGWIYLPGTNISYPLMQGWNNEYYLNRMFDRSYNIAGSIYLDTRVPRNFSGQNHPIYGHNMKNGTMFSQMRGYEQQSFYDQHPEVLIMTPDKNYRVVLFSAYAVDIYADAWQLSFSEAEYDQWLKDRKTQSCFQSDVTPETGDQVITFSTCYRENGFGDSGRFVVHGILVEEN